MTTRPVLRASARCAEELNGILERLGQPARGLMRVFRGQTRRFIKPNGDVLLAALHRPGSRGYDVHWSSAVQLAAFDG